MKRLGCSCINTQPSGGTGSLRLPLIKRQQFTQTLLTHFCLIKKIRTKLNKPDLTLIIVSGCKLIRHLIAKTTAPLPRGRPFSFRATSLHTLNPPGVQVLFPGSVYWPRSPVPYPIPDSRSRFFSPITGPFACSDPSCSRFRVLFPVPDFWSAIPDPESPSRFPIYILCPDSPSYFSVMISDLCCTVPIHGSVSWTRFPVQFPVPDSRSCFLFPIPGSCS